MFDAIKDMYQNNKKRFIIVAVAIACVFIAVCYGFSKCSSGAIKIEESNLIADHTCYIGNYNCPKLYVKVANNSNSTYYVYVDVSFYYQGSLASSESSEGVTLTGGDTYTFVIQSSVGTRLFMDRDNWTYKITNTHTIKK